MSKTNVRVSRTTNAAGIERILTLGLGNAELLAQDDLLWFAVRDSEESVIGVAYAAPISSVRTYVSVVYLPGKGDDAERRAALRALSERVTESVPAARKLETTVPVEMKDTVRVYQQSGYRREGVARSSIRVDGELVDQVYLGLVL